MRIALSSILLLGLSILGHCDLPPPPSAPSLLNTSLHNSSSHTNTHAAPCNPFDDTNCPIGLPPQSSPQTAGDWDPNNLASDADWIRYRTKGHWLGCLLAGTDAASGAAWPDPYRRNPLSASSPWRGTLEREMAAWQWYESQMDQFNCFFGDTGPAHWVFYRKVETAFNDLGLDLFPRSMGGHNTCYSVEHGKEDLLDENGDEYEQSEQVYDVAGQEYQCTAAFYRFGINHIGGAIYVTYLENPRTAARKNWGAEPQDTDLPALRLASDIISAYWLRGNPAPHILRYYIAFSVVNDQTVPLLARILRSQNMDLVPFWPGLKVPMATQEYQAILGSPIGATLAFLLIQHKAELGIKMVSEIVIFRENNPANTLPDVNILFRIMDVPYPIEGEAGETNGESSMAHAAEKRAEEGKLVRVHTITA